MVSCAFGQSPNPGSVGRLRERGSALLADNCAWVADSQLTSRVSWSIAQYQHQDPSLEVPRLRNQCVMGHGEASSPRSSSPRSSRTSLNVTQYLLGAVLMRVTAS